MIHGDNATEISAKIFEVSHVENRSCRYSIPFLMLLLHVQFFASQSLLIISKYDKLFEYDFVISKKYIGHMRRIQP